MTVFDTLGSWTIDEQAVGSRRQDKQPETPPVHPKTDEAWVAFLRALLQTIAPYRDAYQAALALVRQNIAIIEAHEAQETPT